MTGAQSLPVQGPCSAPKLAVLLSFWGCWLQPSEASSPAGVAIGPQQVFAELLKGTNSVLGPGAETNKTRSLPLAGSPSSPGASWQGSGAGKGQCGHRRVCSWALWPGPHVAGGQDHRTEGGEGGPRAPLRGR